MNIKTILLLVLVSIFLSGCSSLPSFMSGNGDTGVEEKDHGPGLKVNFDIDDEFLPTLRYELTLENDGEQTIEISQNDIFITTIEREFSGEIPLKSEDIENFKNQLFQNGNLMLGPHQERKYSGILNIDSNYYKESTNNKISLILRISYPYETKFSANVQVNKEDFEFGTQSIKMSGPISISSIEGIFSSQNNLDIVYTLKDRGNAQESITVLNPSFLLGTKQLSCSTFKDSQGNKVETQTPQISKEISEVYFLCNVDISDYSGITTTMTSGSYSYEYITREERIINFPETRSSGFN